MLRGGIYYFRLPINIELPWNYIRSINNNCMAGCTTKQIPSRPPQPGYSFAGTAQHHFAAGLNFHSFAPPVFTNYRNTTDGNNFCGRTPRLFRPQLLLPAQNQTDDQIICCCEATSWNGFAILCSRSKLLWNMLPVQRSNA